MARKKKDENYWPEPTPDRQLEHGSGWCMTGYHNDCKYQFNHGKCGCECHKNVKDNVDPRPWRENEQ